MLKKFVKTVVFLVCLVSTAAVAGDFRVVRVYDGDSLKVAGHDVVFKVRLAGIDAPETPARKGSVGQPFSRAAKKRLAELVLQRVVDVKGYGLGPYNRIIAVVSVDGRNVNLEMVRSGLAEVYPGAPPRGLDMAPYKASEAAAQKAGLGVWSLGDKRISPRDWRRGKKQK